MRLPAAVLFDLDGTLVDTSEMYRLATRYILNKYLGHEGGAGGGADGDAGGTDALAAEVDRMWGLPLDVIMSRVGARAAPQMVRDFVDFYMQNHRGRVWPYPDVREALDALRAGGQRVAVVTSKRRVPAESDLALAGFDGLYETLVGHEDVKRHKPDPAALLLALRRLGCPAGAALMVGDSVVDVEAGRAAGIATAAALWGTFDAPTLLGARPDWVLRSPRELAQFCVAAPAWPPRPPATAGR